MKASAYEQTGAPEVLKYVDLPDPICGPSQVRIEVKAISLEGGDVLNRGMGRNRTSLSLLAIPQRVS